MIGWMVLIALIVLDIVVFGIFVLANSFIGNIIVFESILTSIVAAIVLTKKVGVHSAISLCIGIVIFIALILIQKTLIGFAIIAFWFSIFWAFIFMLIAYIFSNEDLIWAIVGAILGFISTAVLHIKVRTE